LYVAFAALFAAIGFGGQASHGPFLGLLPSRQVTDLHEIITVRAPGSHPALIGASWGAMLALAYATAHPGSTGPLILVGCGTFDLGARATYKGPFADRMNDDICAQLKRAEQLDPNERVRANAEAMLPVRGLRSTASPYDDDQIDALPRWRLGA
jgi:pimeloyl-ACP methyl ester carboxylesterase